MSYMRSGPGLVQLQRSNYGWELTMEGYTEPAAVGSYLWPGGVPAGVNIALTVAVTEPIQLGTFMLTGLSLPALQTMEPWIANWFAQEGLFQDDSSGSTGASSSTAPGTARPDVKVKMDESELREWVEHALHGTEVIGTVGEIAGFFAEEASTLAVVGEILGGAGHIAGTIIVLWATARAFGTGTRLQEQQGFCYGLMWETFGMPNGGKRFIDWAPDSADELRNAFYEGVAEGREKAGDLKVQNAIKMAVAYEMASVRSDERSAQQNFINEMWKQVRESKFATDWLDWPTPADMRLDAM